MIQLNVLVAFIVFLVNDLYQEKKNPLSKQVFRRLQHSSRHTVIEKKPNPISKILLNIFKSIENNAERTLQRANLDFTAKEYAVIRVSGLLGGFFLGFALFPFPPIFKTLIFFSKNTVLEIVLARILSGVLFGGVGSSIPFLLVKFRERKRMKLLENQLIDFILGLADGIKTARTPQEALRVLADEMPDPLSTELRRTVQDIDFAIPYTEALDRFIDRVRIDEYTLIINALQIQSTGGGRLEDMLRNMAQIAEERRETRSEVLKIVRETKSVAYAILAAPIIFFFGFLYLMEDDFADYIFTPIGLGFIIINAILYVISVVILIAINKEVEKVL